MSDDGILHFNPWMDFNDGPPSENPFGCDPDPEQIAVFLDTVFSWCEGLIPLRGFVDKGQGRDGKPHNIWIPADDTAPDKLATFAAWANREGAAVYVIPGTVEEQGQARAADVLQMQAIVVDLDAGEASRRLKTRRESSLPQATSVVIFLHKCNASIYHCTYLDDGGRRCWSG